MSSSTSPAPRAEPSAATAPGPAPASEPPPLGYLGDGSLIADRVSMARELFAAGKYMQAAELLGRIITVDPRPIHYFNLGQTQRRAGQIDEARQSYRHFIEIAPQHPSVPEARAYMRELDSVAAQVAQAEKRYRSQLDRTRGELLQQLDLTRGELLSERAQVAQLRRGGPVYKRAWFWLVLGGTFTAVATAGIVAGVLLTQRPEPPPTDTGYIGFGF